MNLFGVIRKNINQADIGLTWNDLLTKENSGFSSTEVQVHDLFKRNIIIYPKKTHNEPTVSFTDFKEKSGKLGKFRMELQVFDVLPDGSDFVKVYCSKCQTTYI